MATLKRSNAGDLRRFFVAKRTKKDDDKARDHAQDAALPPRCRGSSIAALPFNPSPGNEGTDSEKGQRAPLTTTTTMRATRVVRLRRRGGDVVQDCDVYIGRRWTVGGWDLPQSEWANPYTVRQVGSAAEAVRLYEHEHLARRPDLVAKVGSLKGLVLGCWCKNKPDDPCHGDVLARLADAAPRASAQEQKAVVPGN